MTGNTISITMTSDDRDVISSFRDQNNQIIRNQEALRKMGTTGKKAHQENETGLGKVKNAAVGVASSVGLITSGVGLAAAAVRVLTFEWEKNLRAAREAQAAQAGAGNAVRRARINFVADATVGEKQLESLIQKTAQERGSTAGTVSQVFSTAFSAKGTFTNQQAINASNEVLRLLPNDVGASEELVGRVLDVGQAGKTDNFKAIIGSLQQLQSASRVTSLDKLGASAVPAIIGALAVGDTVEQGEELFATLTALSGDKEGAKSKTGAINLQNRLKNFVGETKGSDNRGKFKVPQDQIDAFERATNTQDRISVLQQNEALRRQFFSKNSFEAVNQVPIENLLSGERGAVAVFKDKQRSISPLGDDLADLFDERVAQLNAGKFQAAVDAEERSKANVENFELGNSLGGRSGRSRSILENSLNKVDLSGPDFITRSSALWRFDYLSKLRGVEPELAAQTVLREQQSTLSDEGSKSLFEKQIQLLQENNELQRQILSEQKNNGANTRGKRPRQPKAAENNRN